jgi:hypothetical protein
MTITQANLSLAEHKLAAFEQLQPEFECCFHFVQDVQGQRRFETFPVSATVRYLHALWICECKDRLLSVPKNMPRYEGSYCLKLLQSWQTGASAEVSAFLQRKLDGMSFADLTSQIELAQGARQVNSGLIAHLTHGRQVLLNRAMNLTKAFDTIFALSMQELIQEVQAACEKFGHRLEQMEQQLAEMETPLYACVPHQLLAQRNMLIMNKVGINALTLSDDLPGTHLESVIPNRVPAIAFAEYIISGYRELTSQW